MESEKVIPLGKVVQKTKEWKITKLMKTQMIVTLVSLILGTLLHFTYQWSGENSWIASFSAVNESVWEHLKLVFYPMLLTAIIEYFFVKKYTHNYVEAKTIGIFISMAFIVVFFFTYTGILGTNFLVIDILTFIASIILGEWVSYRLMKRRNESTTSSLILSGVILAILTISFIVCTYLPPEVNLFKDPTNGSYGMSQTKDV